MILNFGDWIGLYYMYWGLQIGLCIGLLDYPLGIMDWIVYCICFMHARWLLLLPFPLSISFHSISFHVIFEVSFGIRQYSKITPKKLDHFIYCPFINRCLRLSQSWCCYTGVFGVVLWLTELWSHDELKKTTHQPHRIHKCMVNVGKYSIRPMDPFGKKNK